MATRIMREPNEIRCTSYLRDHKILSKPVHATCMPIKESGFLELKDDLIVFYKTQARGDISTYFVGDID